MQPRQNARTFPGGLAVAADPRDITDITEHIHSAFLICYRTARFVLQSSGLVDQNYHKWKLSDGIRMPSVPRGGYAIHSATPPVIIQAHRKPTTE